MGCLPVRTRQGINDGELATAIEGVGSQGQPLRLRDYRGKVVLLCFWHAG
jgi:hypothetical protein